MLTPRSTPRISIISTITHKNHINISPEYYNPSVSLKYHHHTIQKNYKQRIKNKKSCQKLGTHIQYNTHTIIRIIHKNPHDQ